MGNENSTTDNQPQNPSSRNVILWPPNPGPPQRTSSAQSPGALQPPGNGQNIERKLEEKPRSTDRGHMPSVEHGGSHAAPEGATSLDLGIASPEVTEPRKHLQKSWGPEGSPLPSPPAPWEQESPSGSVPFAESPPTACSASPPATPEGWPLVRPLAQHLRRKSSPNVQGGALAAFAFPGDGPAQYSVAAIVPSAGRENDLREEGHLPFAESPPEACSASPPPAPEHWPLVRPSARHLRRKSSPNVQWGALAASASQGDGPSQHSAVANVPSAGRERDPKEEGRKPASSSSSDQLPGISPVPRSEPVEAQLAAEDSRPGGCSSQRKEAAGGLPPPESGVQVAPTSPSAAQSVKESSAGLEEGPPAPETPAPQEPAPGASACQAEMPLQDSVADSGSLGACCPTGSNSGAAPEAEATAAPQESGQQQMGPQPPRTE
ncbi:transforming acidic coiled-coil-containing protein 2-like, partial [Pteronotus mesoamericanus]|uniref:transforming acidic coiled-coil-containing protein 2-like n=1 Tax=Pteronotus mesoamericanus TaxID=1884717 RepID=UPI0023ED3377